MAAANTSPVRPPNDRYGPLLTRHVKTILESGLLLDEDYEVLLNACNFKMYPAKSTAAAPFGLITGGLATIASVFLARKYNQPIVVIFPLAATCCFLCWERKAMIKRRQRRDIVGCVVRSFVKLRRLNAVIIRYLKMRKDCSAKEQDAWLLSSENILEFVAHFVRRYGDYCRTCLEQLSFLAKLTGDLAEDYQGVKEIELSSVLNTDSCSADNVEALAARVHDIYTFLSSKYLNYLGLTFASNLQNANEGELEILLDIRVPCINTTLDQLSSAILNEFNNLRYCTAKKLQIDTKIRNPSVRQLSGKLQQTLTGAVNNLSIIMQKSQAVLEKVDDIEEGDQAKKLGSALEDLRDHAFATYESLDILCKLYGILSNARRPQDESRAVKFNNKQREDLERNSTTTINYDDTSEALEENYELFIPDNEELDSPEPKNRYQEDQSGVYLNLMLKELRQSLTQHERFVAARSKRGVEAEGDENVLPKASERPVPIPKFDLKQVDSAQAKSAPDREKSAGPVPAPRSSKLSAPPPPPPPPRFDNLDGGDTANDSKGSLFDNIRTLSSQLKGGEDVFGDDCSSDSE